MIKATPSARKKAFKEGINVNDLAKAKNNTVLRVEDLSQSNPSNLSNSNETDQQYWNINHQSFGEITTKPLNKFQLIASSNLSASNRLIPQVTHHDYAVIDSLESFRQAKKQLAQSEGVRLTLLPFIIFALARALKKFPQFNSSLDSSGKNQVFKHYVHIAIAVDTMHALVVPVIRDADQKGIYQLAKEVTELADLAQSKKLKTNQTGGASITISNLGAFGGVGFTPIINPPEVAILGISQSENHLVLEGKKPKNQLRMPLDLSYDHRLINGVDAAKFVSTIKKYLSQPETLLLH